MELDSAMPQLYKLSLEKTASWYYRVTQHFLEKEQRAEFICKEIYNLYDVGRK